MEVQKPLRRGVLLQAKKDAAPEWFDIQFEKLPFYCKSCGLMGHMHLECPTPSPKNALGKLPYDLKLRAPEEKRKKPQSFGAAAAETFGTSRTHSGQTPAPQHIPRQGGEHRASETGPSSGQEANADVNSSKTQEGKGREAKDKEPVKNPSKEGARPTTESPRKRTRPGQYRPVQEHSDVPSSLVKNRLAQLGNNSGRTDEINEVQKKQRVSSNPNARSAAAAGSSPRRAP
jgi:hypothetical protein